ncbi:MAG: methylmalonyl Co-A mutase-associated GTPase MeaB, partial [Dehalococcoidia bacterium]|nr:methylmalonyl Co-A mutase-associated GTPase MeaB [Dehalococcoidia bacterium]
EMVQKMLGGDELCLARLITMIERSAPEVPRIMSQINLNLGKSHIVGITGPPGGGKSSIADRLTGLMRADGFSVGMVACDPSSPFSGGAVLGDRIRMQQHYLDKGVFIRSMATRDGRGGLSPTAKEVLKLMDAFGKDFVLVETVGVGQTELDIMDTADTVVVVLVPEAGDAIQAMKAGILEIADIFVINKADREGADAVAEDLKQMLRLNPKHEWWEVPVLTTEAINNVGIDELYEGIKNHRRALEEAGQLDIRRKAQRRAEFLQVVERSVRERILALIKKNEQLTVSLERVEQGEIDPYSATDDLLASKALLQTWRTTLEGEE